MYTASVHLLNSENNIVTIIKNKPYFSTFVNNVINRDNIIYVSTYCNQPCAYGDNFEHVLIKTSNNNGGV